MREGHAILALWCAIAAACAVKAAQPQVEFSGVLTNEGRVKLALTDKTRDVTHWVEPGEDFLGYDVTRYDPEQEAIYLKKDGQEHRVSLVPSKSVLPGAATTAASGGAPAINSVTANAIRSNLRQFLTAARRFQVEHGTTHVSFADVVGPGKYIRELVPVAGEDYSTLIYAPSVTALSVATPTGGSVTLETGGSSSTLGVAATAPAPTAPTATAASTVPANQNTPGAAPALGAASTRTPPATSEALTPTGTTHVARGGESLAEVARASGVSVEQLQALNPGVNAGSLQAGQVIRIR